MLRRIIRRVLTPRRDFPYGKCFISHSYDDEASVKKLQEMLGNRARPFIFPQVGLPPHKMVSNTLIRSIRKCDTLIYLSGGRSSLSPWVTMERDYAARIGMDIYCFDPDKETIQHENHSPFRLPVFASYSSKDRRKVLRLLKFMRRKRSFDIKDGETSDNEIMDTLSQGGYVILFWSTNSIKSLWVEREIRLADKAFPDRILPVLLDDTELPLNIVQSIVSPIHLYSGKKIDRRRFDDLIVRLYWTIHRNTQSSPKWDKTQALGKTMLAICKRCQCDGWLQGTEYIVPELCKRIIARQKPHPWGNDEISLDEARSLTATANELGHWVDLDVRNQAYIPFDPFPFPKEYADKLDRPA